MHESSVYGNDEMLFKTNISAISWIILYKLSAYQISNKHFYMGTSTCCECAFLQINITVIIKFISGFKVPIRLGEFTNSNLYIGQHNSLAIIVLWTLCVTFVLRLKKLFLHFFFACLMTPELWNYTRLYRCVFLKGLDFLNFRFRVSYSTHSTDVFGLCTITCIKF